MLADIAFINWTLGMVLIMLSNATVTVPKTGYKRTRWRKYRMGYSIKEIKKAIEMTGEQVIKEKLKRKILFRRFAYLLLLSAPILLFINGIKNG